MAALDADMVRYVPWFPYPYWGVAELEAPTATSTSWNFTHLDWFLEKFMNATYEEGRSVIINFSTTPQWVWANASTSYPSGVWESDFGYSGSGTVLRDPSGKVCVCVRVCVCAVVAHAPRRVHDVLLSRSWVTVSVLLVLLMGAHAD